MAAREELPRRRQMMGRIASIRERACTLMHHARYGAHMALRTSAGSASAGERGYRAGEARRCNHSAARCIGSVPRPLAGTKPVVASDANARQSRSHNVDVENIIAYQPLGTSLTTRQAPHSISLHIIASRRIWYIAYLSTVLHLPTQARVIADHISS